MKLDVLMGPCLSGYHLRLSPGGAPCLCLSDWGPLVLAQPIQGEKVVGAIAECFDALRLFYLWVSFAAAV